MMKIIKALLIALSLPVLAHAADSGGPAAKPAATPAEEAYRIVKTAALFSIGPVGEEGRPSKREAAFRQLLKQPEPLARCQKLLTEATPAGQLYGLLGLRLLDEKAFQAALPAYKNLETEIPTMTGCILTRVKAADIAARIENGKLK